jgi:REP element-mobilizing transposase RayT
MQGMATPRAKLVDQTIPLNYHLVSRCVRRGWLCGIDPISGKDYSHRKKWLIDRMFHLARYFAVEIDAFAVLSSHFHLVVYYDPIDCHRWTDEDVAFRWVEAFPPMVNGVVVEDLKPLYRENILDNKSLLDDRRNKLGCLSTFMKHLKQPVARRANREDGCRGHFFESRFYSGALLSEQALLASMAYVDLNPVRARIAQSIEQCQNTSIQIRIGHLENTLERLREVIEPLVSGIVGKTHRFQITLADYVERLDVIIHAEVGKTTVQLSNKQSRWLAQVTSIRKRQRAYGSTEALTAWTERRGLKRPGSSLPG